MSRSVSRDGTHGWKEDVPLLAGDHGALLCSLRCAIDRSRQPPRLKHLFFQSSCASTTSEFSALRHPLFTVRWVTRSDRGEQESAWLTDVEFVSFSCQYNSSQWKSQRHSLPFVINGLDDEAQSWTDCGDIFIHDALHNGSLSSIVKATVQDLAELNAFTAQISQHQYPHLLVFQSGFA